MIPGNINTDLISGADEGGYQISRSIRLNASDSAFLSRTPASAGNRQNWTWSGWVKRSNPDTGARQVLFSAYGASNDTGYFEFGFDNSANLGKFYWSQWTVDAQSAAVFRDFSAWYHIVVSYNGSNIVVYVNGTSVLTSAKTGDLVINGAFEHGIGRQPNSGRYFSGYLANVEFVDGSALTPSSFAETNATTGQWVPKAYTGSYGTNGFRLTFSDNSGTTATTLGKDAAGSNNWTPNNFSVAAGAGNDSLVDTPTSYGTDTGAGGEVRGNYATLNPLDQSGNNTFSNGNLDVVVAADNNAPTTVVCGSISVSSGKWYWEVTPTAMTTAGGMIGIGDFGQSPASRSWRASGGWYYYGNSGQKYNNGSGAAYGASYANNDVIGIALDLDAGTIVFYKNGASQGTAYSTGLTGKFIGPVFANGTGGGTQAYSVNFGQRPFAYTAPSGFKALCDTNLPAPTIAKPSTVMDVKLYTGNGGTQSITGLGFNPDLVWLKARSAAYGNVLHDAVRGAGYELVSNLTVAESFGAQYLQSFNSDGFTVGNNNAYNQSSVTYAAWAWDAGSSTVTNTSGSISSEVRANASAGFSIVTYTGTGSAATVGHGLGVAPSMIIVKSRNTAATNWGVYHSGISSTPQNSALNLDNTSAIDTQSVYWNNTAPTSTVFSVGTWGGSNGSTRTYVAYCFAPVAGYSAFGSYTGNGSTDGPFVWCGFRPRWVLLKSSSAAGESWFLLDTSRSPYNVSQEYLMPNSSAGETSAYTIMDILSNGFKLKTSGGGSAFNGSGATYVWAAFAESPFAYSRAR